MKQTEILTHATHVNDWEPAVYMSSMSQNFCLFHVSNLSVRNFRIFLLMYTGPTSGVGAVPGRPRDVRPSSDSMVRRAPYITADSSRPDTRRTRCGPSLRGSLQAAYTAEMGVRTAGDGRPRRRPRPDLQLLAAAEQGCRAGYSAENGSSVGQDRAAEQQSGTAAGYGQQDRTAGRTGTGQGSRAGPG